MALPALRNAAVAPAGPEGVERVVMARFSLYPQPKRSAQEWAFWWRDYHGALAALPEESLELGMAAWVRESSSKFLPKPGELRELAAAQPTRGAEAYRRARAAAEMAQEAQRPPVQRPDRGAIAAMMDSFRSRSLANPVASRPDRDPILDEDPIEHEARVRRQHAQEEATIAWAPLDKLVREAPATAKAEDVDAVRAATAAAWRKMADAMTARSTPATTTEGEMR